VTVTFVGDEISNQSCENKFTITRTYRATDVCGNSATCAQIITVNDTIPPMITCPQAITVACAGDVPAPNTNGVSASDNCVSAVTKSFVSDVKSDETCLNRFTLTRTYMVSDACGNTATCTQIITVNDIIPPTIVCPSNLTVQCNGDVPAPNVNGVIASDNCAGTVIKTFVSDVKSNETCLNRYTLTRTYMATDACGNTATCTQIITVNDNTPPTIQLDDPLFADYQNGGVYKIQCRSRETGWVLPNLTENEITVVDNCGSATFILTKEVTDGDCTIDGFFKKMLVKIIAKDDCNNQSQLQFTILIVDTIPPAFTEVPADVTLNCSDANQQFSVKADDECECTSISYTDQKISLGCDGHYMILRKYKAVDCCNNASYYTQKITIEDREAPVIIPNIPELAGMTSGGNIDLFCDENNHGNYPDWVNLAADGMIQGVDKCSNRISYHKEVENLPDGNCSYYHYIKAMKISLTVTDNCGNENELWFTVKMRDTTPPNMVYYSPTVCSTDKEILYATDQCSNVYYNHYDEPVKGECGNGTNYIRTWILTDDCANDTIVTQYVITNPHTNPVIKLTKKGFEKYKSGDSYSLACKDWTPLTNDELLSWVEVEDNCTQAKVDVTQVETRGNCATDGYKKMITITWYASDFCGNSEVFTLHVKLEDHTAPVFVNKESSLTIDCISKLPKVIAIDECGAVKLKVDKLEIPGRCIDEKTIVESYTATDECGNQAFYRRVVNLIDTTGPIIVLDDAICGGEGGNQPSAFDECSGVRVPLTMFEEPQKYDCNGGYYNYRVYTATDACHNVTTKRQQVIYNDHKPPTIEWSRDLLDLTGTDVNDIETDCNNFDDIVALVKAEGAIIVKDDCQQKGFDIRYTDRAEEPKCGPDGAVISHTFTWTAADICGNVATRELTVYQNIDLHFDLSFVPKDTIVYCTASAPWPQELPKVCGILDLRMTSQTEPPLSNGDYREERLFTLEDVCHNIHTGTQTIYHDMTSDLSCRIDTEKVIKCSTSDNVLFADVIGGSGNYTYYWEVLNGSCHLISGQGTPRIKISVSFNKLQIKLTVIDGNGCKTVCYYTADCVLDQDALGQDDSDQVQQNTESRGTSDDQFKIRPNPTLGMSFIDYDVSVSESVDVLIMDNTGKILERQKQTLEKGVGQIKLDTENYAPGVYLISVIGDHIQKTFKLVRIN
ncbi:MAG TPA: T9SS type A sorting domain-containing protein, partial [Saprospiraceae bacterium]|nr:T9SS type A sorting domain-containing protein [Saprospiraceae bacterium]